ncbi:MAG: ROK family protein [Candidatus Omnitrophica bacterium]|jgi:glucokinase|nr:ROK family protein [Candidatus Omnitrophota bacterium]
MKVFLGIDWGGTYIKAGIVNSSGKILKKIVYSSSQLKRRQAFTGEIKRLKDTFKKYNIKAVGIGAPGIINVERGSIYYLPNVPGWENSPLKTMLEKELKIPVFIDNDANIFALAEVRKGAGRGMSRAIFLTLGTGLGGAVIFNGQIIEGKTSASELGHVVIDVNGKKCGCGGYGCIETFTGSNHLLERYRQLKKIKTAPKEVKEIFDKAKTGKKEALIVWQEFSKYLGKFLAGMINIFNPQVIILGGGVSGAFNLFRPLLWQAIKAQAMWPQLTGLKLVKAKLKDAGIIGAALLAKDKLEADTRATNADKRKPSPVRISA